MDLRAEGSAPIVSYTTLSTTWRDTLLGAAFLIAALLICLVLWLAGLRDPRLNFFLIMGGCAGLIAVVLLRMGRSDFSAEAQGLRIVRKPGWRLAILAPSDEELVPWSALSAIHDGSYAALRGDNYLGTEAYARLARTDGDTITIYCDAQTAKYRTSYLPLLEEIRWRVGAVQKTMDAPPGAAR